MTGQKPRKRLTTQRCLHKKRWRGIDYAHPVEWTTPLGETIVGFLIINARLAIGKVYASKRMRMDEFLFIWKNFFGNSVMNIQGLTLWRILNMIL